MVIVILFVLGLCLGSFVNAFVWRFHAQAELRGMQAARKLKPTQAKAEIDALSIAKGRSMCVHCKHELAPKDLIPVISYLSLGGKCRYCRKPIQDTPLAELITPLLFIVSYLFWPLKAPSGFTGAGLVVFCFWLVFLVGFVMLALYDLRWYELPHKIVLPLIALALVQTVLIAMVFSTHQGGGLRYALHAGIGGLIGGGIFYLLYAISPKETLEDGYKMSKWIGGGDITLGFLLGLLVGGPGNALLLIFVASLIGTFVALPLLATGRAQRTSHLPFGPFLLVAAVVVMLVGARIIDWYTSHFIV